LKDGVLSAIRNAPRVGRKHYICQTDEDITNAQTQLQAFWADHPGSRTELEAPPLETFDPAARGMRFFRVDHSIPGSAAFALETPIGWVVYSGDLRRHGYSAWRVEKFVEEAATLEPAVLIVEGTRVNVTESTQEPEVHEAAANVVRRSKGVTIADFSPRNIERLRTFHDIAEVQGKRLVVTTRDAYLLERMNIIDPAIPTPDEEIVWVLEEPSGQRQHWERYVLSRYAGSVIDAAAIRKAPKDYVLCLSFWDISNLIDLEPEGGTYIYSSSEAYNEEQLLDHERLGNWLDHFGLTPVGGLPGSEKGPFHASGHMDGPGMQWLVETINPRKIVPVHTQALDWFEERWPEQVVCARYGVPVQFS
jgi:ribonuclease J